MNILILTEGSKDIGFGHLTRCTAFFQGIKELSTQAKVRFLIYGDKDASDFMRAQKTDVINFNWFKETNKVLTLARNSGLVIIDSYLAKKYIYEQISEITDSRLLMIDDYNRIEYPRGIVVNSSIYGDKLSYPKKKGLTYLLGKDYIILRKEFWNVPEKNIKKKVKNILVTLGGVNHYKLSQHIAKFIKNKFGIISFLAGTDKHKFSAQKMLDLMLNSDICISGGGQTINELARIGMPTIGVCFAKNQRLNLEAWDKMNFMENLGWYYNRNIFARLDKTINLLLSKRERQKRYKIGKSNVDGKGVFRILNTLMHVEGQFKLREITENDCYDLWAWRNHPDVRKWSLNTEEIEYKKHREWFRKKIKDRHVKIYIAENIRGEKLGQIRFDTFGGAETPPFRAGKECAALSINTEQTTVFGPCFRSIDLNKQLAQVSINLNPKFFGKGIGSSIIEKGTAMFVEENQMVQEVIAEIIERNIVSKKAFMKAGYIFLHNIFKNGKRVSILKLGTQKC